jgi:hypothetical protein
LSCITRWSANGMVIKASTNSDIGLASCVGNYVGYCGIKAIPLWDNAGYLVG